MEKKTILIPSIVIILILIGGFFIWWKKNTQNIRKEILATLKENLEFCEILKEKNSFNNKGEFWLICNGRPFYAEYENGNLEYKLNGWSWLENTNYWNELNNCNFYKAEKSEESYNLIFYCPWDFNSDKLTAKSYQFNLNNLELEKIKEEDFLEVLDSHIKEIYGFLSNCSISNFTSYKYEGYPPVLSLIFSCEDGDYLIATDLKMIPIQPPILMDSEISNEERAKISFEKSFGFSINNITSWGDSVTISSNNNLFNYAFKELPTLNYRLKCPENEKCLREFGKFFIFPPIHYYTDIEFIKERMTLPLAIFYRIDDKIISIGKSGENIISFGMKTEFLYEK